VPPETKDEDTRPDKIKEDKEGKQGNEKEKVMGKRLMPLPADVWMRNLSVSPADFLRTKFSVENGAPPAAASSTRGAHP